MGKRVTDIYSSDFEGFSAEVASGIWNKLVDLPPFQALQPKDYPGLFDAVSKILARYRRGRPLISSS